MYRRIYSSYTSQEGVPMEHMLRLVAAVIASSTAGTVAAQKKFIQLGGLILIADAVNATTVVVGRLPRLLVKSGVIDALQKNTASLALVGAETKNHPDMGVVVESMCNLEAEVAQVESTLQNLFPQEEAAEEE